MKVRVVIGTVIVLGVIGATVALGVQQFQHKQQLAAFQSLIREGSAQAEATLGLISLGSISILKIPPECDRFVEERRGLTEKVYSVDSEDFRYLQSDYVALLNAQDDLMLKVGLAEKFLLGLVDAEMRSKSDAEICTAERVSSGGRSAVRERSAKVFSMERKFQSDSAALGLDFKPVFTNYKEFFAENSKDTGHSFCPQP